uniref:Uncharacterized protein n=1 Tax=Timema genevievae TaxID=629358 RepID=A0A7R9PPN9_TIMGE|nr:unnamed protein product [Timema genevievae]
MRAVCQLFRGSGERMCVGLDRGSCEDPLVFVGRIWSEVLWQGVGVQRQGPGVWSRTVYGQPRTTSAVRLTGCISRARDRRHDRVADQLDTTEDSPWSSYTANYGVAEIVTRGDTSREATSTSFTPKESSSVTIAEPPSGNQSTCG